MEWYKCAVTAFLFFFNDPATTKIYTSVHTLSLHDALPLISFPFTIAHTSGACCVCLLQPAAIANTIAARGSHAAASFTPLECFIGYATERRFATVNFKVGCSGGFLHSAVADACRAHTDLLPHARHHRMHALQVRIPPPPPRTIRVADHISKTRRFAAEFTLQCHFCSRLICSWASVSRSNCRKTKLLILADPIAPAKSGVCIPDESSGYAFCIPDGFAGRAVCRAPQAPVLPYGIVSLVAYQ